MSWGTESYGVPSWSGTRNSTTPTLFEEIFPEQFPVADLQIQYPILEFYEILAPDNTYTRVVNFGELEASATPGYVTFDGNDYLSVHLARSALEEAIDGSLPETSVSIVDYNHAVLGWVSDNDGMVGATVTLYVISYDDIDTPAAAASNIFRVKRVISEEGPARITFILASPAFLNLTFPRTFYNRHHCVHPWQDRFNHDDKNFCNGHSDEFELQTYQDFRSATSNETEKDYGWYVLNGDHPEYIKIGDGLGSSTDKAIIISANNAVNDLRWKDANRNGVFLFKKVPSSEDTDVDICIKVAIASASTDDQIIGICLQADGAKGYSFFWGKQKFSGTERYLARETINDTSSDTTYTGTYSAFRLKRVGDSITCYVRDEDVSYRELSTDAWTQKHTDTFSINGDINIGVVFGVEDAYPPQVSLAQDLYHFRFLAGGYEACNRTLSNCALIKNTVQFGGYLGLPDGTVSW